MGAGDIQVWFHHKCITQSSQTISCPVRSILVLVWFVVQTKLLNKDGIVKWNEWFDCQLIVIPNLFFSSLASQIYARDHRTPVGKTAFIFPTSSMYSRPTVLHVAVDRIV